MKTARMLAILVLTLGLTAEVANADFTFGTPTNLGPTINSASLEETPCISADGLLLYFASGRPGGHGGSDLWTSTRLTIEDDWLTPTNLGPVVNSSADDFAPCVSADGLELYFYSKRPSSYGSWDLWVANRQTKEDDWNTPVNVGPVVNGSTGENDPIISADGLELYFTSERPGGYGGWDIWLSTRQTTDNDWDTPVNLGIKVNSAANDGPASISTDGLMLFIHSTRPGGFGYYDIWLARRATISDPWGEPVNIGSMVNTTAGDMFAKTSGDGRWLYFQDWAPHRPGGFGNVDLWQAPILPIVDLNGDGIVNDGDMCIMVDNWGTDETLCDIGPMPWGDGIVDVQDLIVLAEHLFEEVNDPTLIAHWALDEAEGIVAHDSAGYSDAYFIGSPLWQPSGGQVDGALLLDGVDDCAITGSIPNPTEEPFSIFVWVKGGAPGQAVLSQMGGARWLCADPSEGNLMTELKGTGRGAAELLSQTIITDGNWHRIGLVWDGSHRTLYVDDVAVAEDEQTNLAASENGLYIGTGKAMEPGSFWSGLIDDVRIYNRAVTP